jgi:hypothetical protein
VVKKSPVFDEVHYRVDKIAPKSGYSEDGSSIFLRKVGTYLPKKTVKMTLAAMTTSNLAFITVSS